MPHAGRPCYPSLRYMDYTSRGARTINIVLIMLDAIMTKFDGPKAELELASCLDRVNMELLRAYRMCSQTRDEIAKCIASGKRLLNDSFLDRYTDVICPRAMQYIFLFGAPERRTSLQLNPVSEQRLPAEQQNTPVTAAVLPN